MTDVYLVQELYSNSLEYSSLNERFWNTTAVCSTLENAAEIVANHKISEIQKILQDFTIKGFLHPIKESISVVKVSLNTRFESVQEFPRIPITENYLKPETKQLLEKSLNDLKNTKSKMTLNHNMTSQNNNLYVDPNVYIRDRKARENENLKRQKWQPVVQTHKVYSTLQQNPLQPQHAQPVTVNPVNPIQVVNPIEPTVVIPVAPGSAINNVKTDGNFQSTI